MCSRWLISIFCGLILLQTLKIEAWSGHVCTKYLVTYLNERYCYSAKYWWWTGEHTCKEWKDRQKSRIYSLEYCCYGWKHNGNQLCNIPICTSACKNGGTCRSPNVCVCSPGYTGSICEIRKDEVINVSTGGVDNETLTHPDKTDMFTKHLSLVKRQVKICGGYLTATTWPTPLTSPNYPNEYENNIRCNWTIQSPVNYIISLRITDIDFEQGGNCLFDYLKVNLGSNNVLETNRICTKSNIDLIFISRSSKADVNFVTDGSNVKTGFSLQYQAVTNCGGYLTAQTQARTLNSPNYPYQYENNLYCHWTIEAGMNYRISIRIKYIDLDENTQCTHDYLQVYLGNTPIIETDRICRMSNTDLNFISSSEEADVIFVTDRSITKTGFSLEYQAAVANCGGYLTAETWTTTLTSPYYPYQYENNLLCNWIIQAPMNYKIAIRITDIDLEQSGNCSDYLKINLGSNNETNRICMNSNTDLIFISRSNKADVTFVTDGSGKKSGFSLQYQTVEPCGGYITAEISTSTLNSPSPPSSDYPYRYGNNLRCNWTIQAERNCRIAIRITDIHLEQTGNCVFDYLKINLGSNNVLETNRICTKSNTDLIFISESNKADVVFVTDRLTTKFGFALQYQAVSICGGSLAAQTWKTTLTSPSPNFPHHYEYNLYCNWTIEAPMNYTIAIRITDIDFENSGNCLFDYLKINLGSNNVLETNRICMKNNTDLIFISRSNKAGITLVMDGSTTKTDFALQYHAVTNCGGYLTAQTWTSTLNSPNYPYQYENNLYCHWTIQAEMNYRIAINIQYIDLDEDRECSKDYLQLYLGNNPILETGRICGKNNTSLYFLSRSNETDVIFVTDGSRTNTGFSLQYQGICSCEDRSGDMDCSVNLHTPLQNGSGNVNRFCVEEQNVTQQPAGTVTWIIISVVGFVVVLIIVGLCCCCCRRKQQTKCNLDNTICGRIRRGINHCWTRMLLLLRNETNQQMGIRDHRTNTQGASWTKNGNTQLKY